MRGRIGALAAMDEAGRRALQQAKKVFLAWMQPGGALPATSRGYDCMDAGGRAKQDAGAEIPSRRHRKIHRTVGGASAATPSIASRPNSYARCPRRNAGARRRSSEYIELPRHSGKTLIRKAF